MKLLEHFKELTLHPKNTEELKGLILQLAVQGKLTRQWREQNSHVEHASLFFQRIKEEKERLIRVKILKKENDILEIEENEISFSTPKSWKWIRLGDVMSIIRGVTFKKSETSEVKTNGSIGVLRGQNMNNSKINKQNLIYLSRVQVKDAQIIKKGDIAITLSSGSDHLVGKIGLSDHDEEFTIGAFYGKLLVFESSLKFYLLNYLDSPLYKNQLRGAFRGIGINNLSNEKVKNLYFPLPPFEEQKAIVEVVNQLFAEVEQLEALTKKRIQMKGDFVTSALNQLTQAAEQDTASQWTFLQRNFGTFFTEKESIKKLREGILQLAVQGKLTHHWRATVRLRGIEVESAATLLEKIKAEKESLVKTGKIKKEKPLPEISEDEVPYELPEGWVWCRFGTIIESMANGLYKPANFYTEKGIISLRMFNIQSGFIEFQGAKRVEVSDEELNRYTLSENDLLINRVNSFELIGKTAIIPLIDEKMVYESMNIRTRLVFKNSIAPYFNQFLQSEYARNYLMSNSKQAIGQASINQTTICNLFSPLPPIKEQKAIVEKVNALMALCDKLEQEIEIHKTTQGQWMHRCLRDVVKG